jgi:hypothetical protein
MNADDKTLEAMQVPLDSGRIVIEPGNRVVLTTANGQKFEKQYPAHWTRVRIWAAVQRDMGAMGGEVL